MNGIFSLLLYSLGLIVYMFLVLHSVSAINRTRDEKAITKLFMYAYFIVVTFGIPFIFIVWTLVLNP